jgi:serine/threonine-protein kinase ULK/ATG1
VKPANILIVNDEIKIADFGFAKRNATQKTMNETTVGSPLYMSLQLLKGEPYSSKCDVWGLGLIFYQLLHNKTPWTAKTAYELIKCI